MIVSSVGGELLLKIGFTAFWYCRLSCLISCSKACPSSMQTEFATYRQRFQRGPSVWESKTSDFVSSRGKTEVSSCPKSDEPTVLVWSRWRRKISDNIKTKHPKEKGKRQRQIECVRIAVKLSKSKVKHNNLVLFPISWYRTNCFGTTHWYNSELIQCRLFYRCRGGC